MSQISSANRVRAVVALDRLRRGVLFVIMAVGAVIFMIPLWVSVVMSLKTPFEIANSSPWAFPKQITWENYQTVLTNPNANFFLFFKNSFVISILGTTGVLITSAMVAYAFARMQFRGRDGLFMLLLSTMMLPGVVTMIPQYVLFARVGWVDTHLPLWVPAWFGGGAYNIFLLRQFFLGIPRELDEAALIDGASHATVFWRVIMPLSGAALATVGVFSFIYNWRDFMGPLIYLNDPEKQTLELGLRTYQTLQMERWELLMAASVLVLIPLVIIFLAGQKFFVKGIVMTGGK